MTSIFISYSALDRRLAEQLAQELERCECSVSWDRTVQPGTRWDREIERELKAAKCVVVLWTSNSRESEWVANEATAALKRNSLFPVRVDDAEPPLEFLRRQAIRISTTSADGVDSAIRDLAQAIFEFVKRRDFLVADEFDAADWRVIGGFSRGDKLLAMLPEQKPEDKTRYELCRTALERRWQESAGSLDFNRRAKDTFEHFTTDAGATDLPNQRDAETALLLAHQLTEEYARFGKEVRAGHADNGPPEVLAVPKCFNRIYLNTVNSFIKDIFKIIENRDSARRFDITAHEQDIAAASKHIIKFTRIEPRRSGERRFAGPEIHATYALGRLRANLPFMGVQEMLAKFEGRLDKRLEGNVQRDDDFARQLRLMRRTVLLSRAMLGSKDSLKRYVTLVQNSFLETDVNAGFHLEYYCDQARDEKLPLCSRDEGRACDKTLGYLIASLQRALASDLNRSKHPLHLVETYTLASIVARRIHAGHDETVRRALPIIEKLHKRVEDEDSRTFLELLLDVASSEANFADVEFGRYMAAKNAPRNGWAKRGVLFPETVGSHTASLLWLCRLLPRLDFPSVNVSRVRRILEIHDLAEGITSDIVATSPRDAVEKIERTLMRRLSWLGLYMEPRVDLFDIFSLYEEFSLQQTREAKVARDIDRLDILVQGWSLLKSHAIFDRESVNEMLVRTEAALVTEEVKAILPKARVLNVISAEAFRTTPDSPLKDYYFNSREAKQ